ncbi:12477_t:CDS:2, partial [Gigaspora margarita]
NSKNPRICQEDSDQDMSSCNFDNINSDSLDDECEPISNNMDDEPKTFDRTKSDINWNQESPYSLFENFTNMAIFI